MQNEEQIINLVADQYRDSSNLNARARLHELYSTNPRGWFHWYFDRLTLPAGRRILELGCGYGLLWKATLERLPATWKLTLTDLSEGMVQEARQNLADRADQFTFDVVDAQNIPYPDHSFDVVIANHMLYHVPDRAGAISEIRRVLSPGGQLFAATNGAQHMLELYEMVIRLAPELSSDTILPQPRYWAQAFSLENGAEQLGQHFATVRLERFPDSLKITQAQPLVDYVLSSLGTHKSKVSPQKVAAFTREVEQQIEQHGAIHVTKDSGLLIAG